MRLVSSTSTDDDSVTSQQSSLLWKSRGSRHSSRPSKDKHHFDFIIFKTFNLFQLWKVVLQKLHQTEFSFLLQIQISEREIEDEINVLIGFSFCPVQNELLHRDGFPNASDALCKHSSDGFLLSR
uniref:Uncharacterized protein n=1 Tax=Anguilla anguilla TaxID=7936 RepID=A0A0E9RSD9_ANGAN